MVNLEIIKLLPDEWKDYKNLRLKALKENPEAFGQTLDKALLRIDDEWKMLLTESAVGQKRWVLFAKLNGKLVGMVSGTEMKSIIGGIKVQEMFVASEAREKGVATKLMESLIEQLFKTPDKRILRLGVFKSQEDAVHLYKSLGFEVLEEKTEHFDDGISRQSLIMERKL